MQLLSGCLKIVGAVDLDAEKIGRHAGELAGLSRDPAEFSFQGRAELAEH